MAGFVLIHGAWHGGWCFDPVAERLRAKGHKVVAPDLPGMGGDEDTLRAVTLAGWADFTVEICHALKRELDGEPLVLAGHSRGGLVIGAAAEADPTAMDGLAYICALMVPNGKAGNEMGDVITGHAHDPSAPSYGEIVANGAGWKVDPEIAGPSIAQLSPPDLVRQQVARLVVEPTAPMATTMHISDERWGCKPRWYIECENDALMPVEGQRRLHALFPGTKAIALEADHSPFYSTPDELTDALVRIGEELAA